MKLDVHFYANGNDPFIFPLGEYLVHVHAGVPPGPPPAVPEPLPESELPLPPEPGPRMSVSADWTDIPRPTPVSLPYGFVHPYGVDEIRHWLSEVEVGPGDSPVRFRLDTASSPSGPEIQALLEGLDGFGGHQVSLDIVGWSEPGDD
jgi:hypothetical protein